MWDKPSVQFSVNKSILVLAIYLLSACSGTAWHLSEVSEGDEPEKVTALEREILRAAPPALATYQAFAFIAPTRMNVEHWIDDDRIKCHTTYSKATIAGAEVASVVTIVVEGGKSNVQSDLWIWKGNSWISEAEMVKPQVEALKAKWHIQ